MNQIFLLALTVFLLGTGSLRAQTPALPSYEFKPITAQDFNVTPPSADTGAHAVIIADVGSSTFEGGNKSWFTLVYKRRIRIKILDKNGYDAASASMYVNTGIAAADLPYEMSGTTYNLEGGQVVATPVDAASVFSETIVKGKVRKTFTLPAVKEGSIVEFSFTRTSLSYTTLNPWTFQGKYPCLWSEYQVSIPEFFRYLFLSQGYQPYFIDTLTKDFRNYEVAFNVDNGNARPIYVNFKGNVIHKRWVMKDVPALREEAYTSSIENHLARIQFQLAENRYPDQPVHPVLGEWKTVSEKLLQSEQFGAELDKPNNWLDGTLKELLGSASSDLEKAHRIQAFVRDRFYCTRVGGLLLNSTLKQIFTNRKGSTAELNLLVIAMLRHESMKADPVILSTRDNGFAPDEYPIIDRYNYLVARLMVAGKAYYLDASDPFTGFARLPLYCYNGPGHLIGTEPATVLFSADSIIEKKNTSVLITQNEAGEFQGTFQSRLGQYESSIARREIRDKGLEAYTAKRKNGYGPELTVAAITLDSLQNLDEPLQIHHQFTLTLGGTSLLYFNPILSNAYGRNLLAATRHYPVELSCALQETYVFHMDIPAGYEVEEMPAPARVTLNDNAGLFEYLIVKSDGNVQLRTTINLRKANFSADEYNSLRDFFGFIVKKYSEQIVFRKKK